MVRLCLFGRYTGIRLFGVVDISLVILRPKQIKGGGEEGGRGHENDFTTHGYDTFGLIGLQF
jgi:hypothetical protein